jgi:hypothetical protein
MQGKKRTIAVVAVVVIVVLAALLIYLVVSSPSSSSSPGPALPAFCPTSAGSGSGGNWTQYHGGTPRTGDFPSTFATGPTWSVGQNWQLPNLDGQVYAEPLVCGNTIIVATEDDGVYAVNATSGGILWHKSLGTPVPSSDLPCGDINPTGITSTPVIDVQTGIIYVDAFLSPSVQHWLFALYLKNGTVKWQQEVDPPGVSPTVEQQRAGLILANGMVYVPFGGLYGDCGQYHGYVVGVPANGSTDIISYQVPTQREGAIWGTAGAGLAANGSLYVATGNGASDTSFDFGDSVIELSPTLHEESYFAPNNWVELNDQDLDLGSVAPTVLPNGNVFEVGKEGVGYVLSGTNLGGIGGFLGEQNVCPSGGGAYGSTARVGMNVFVPCNSGLVDLSMSATNMSTAWKVTDIDAYSPIVVGGSVWTVDGNSGSLMGIYTSNGTVFFSTPLGSTDHFISPAAEPGGLLVAGGNELYSFTLGP